MSESIEMNESCSSDNPFGNSDSNSSHPLNDSMENKSIITEKPINGDPILNSACNTYSDDGLDEDLSLNENVNFTKLSNSKQCSDQQVNNQQQPKSPFSDEKLNENLDCEESDDPDDEFMDEDGDMDDEDDDEEEDDDDDDDDFMETDDSSSFSSMSGFTTFFGEGWKAMNWIQSQMTSGVNPRDILSQILNKDISPDLDDMNLWKILASMLTEPPRRQKLPDINTIDDVVNLLKSSEKIIVLTGAGVSVSCGIPDFRSADGIYARLAKDYPDLPDPQAMFDIQYFSNDPRPFFKFAREIYPGQFTPSLCHRFIKLLEDKGKLLRNYTQNIDTLEQVAGISNVIECHGSFATASCTKCKLKQSADDIRGQIFDQKIPVCPKCQSNIDSSILMVENFQQIKTQQEAEEKNDSSSSTETNQNECDKIEKSTNECSQDEKLEEKDAINGNADEKNSKINNKYKELVQNGIMKPDIVFFGEGLPESFHTAIADDKDECDLLIVIGSSLKVRPVALIPNLVPPHIPQVLINLEQLPHMDFDVELLGDSDTTITKLCQMLGQEWLEICPNSEKHQENLQNGSSNINQTDLCSENKSNDSYTENVLDTNTKFSENHMDSSIKLNDH